VVLRRLRYKLSLRDLPEMLLIRGIVFSHDRAAKQIDGREWEAKLTPALAGEVRHRRRGKAGCSWYVDETYIKVHGRWCYLYRAIDRSGALGDVMFSEHRDMAAAKAFFRSAEGIQSKNGFERPFYSFRSLRKSGAGEGIRTLDPNLGKVPDGLRQGIRQPAMA
jgi:transposase-like protein